MSHYIAQPCIGTKDTACVTVCPVDCIHPTKDEPDFATEEMLYIDPDEVLPVCAAAANARKALVEGGMLFMPSNLLMPS